MNSDPRPLVAHVLHRFDTGGLENGVVNLINRLPADRFRHAVIALTEITEFSRRIERDDVQLIALNKPPGQGVWMLAHACVRRATQLAPQSRERMRMRMVIAGEGPLHAEIEQVLKDGGMHDKAWLAGDRNDVPDIMRGLDAFALPSIAEGISNTLLEAMPGALPVVATDVGRNAELLDNGVTGQLVPPRGADTMAAALLQDFRQPGQARERGRRARLDVERRFTLDGMVAACGDLYERLLARAAARGALLRRFT